MLILRIHNFQSSSSPTIVCVVPEDTPIGLIVSHIWWVAATKFTKMENYGEEWKLSAYGVGWRSPARKNALNVEASSPNKIRINRVGGDRQESKNSEMQGLYGINQVTESVIGMGSSANNLSYK